MRDIQDCLIKAFLNSYPEEDYLKTDEFLKCWDYSKVEKDCDRPTPTQYLLDK